MKRNKAQARIQAEAHRTGLSLSDLATEIKMKYNTLYNWSRGTEPGLFKWQDFLEKVSRIPDKKGPKSKARQPRDSIMSSEPHVFMDSEPGDDA